MFSDNILHADREGLWGTNKDFRGGNVSVSLRIG